MLNSVSLVGRLTRDPETRHTTNGKAVSSFSVAVSTGRKVGDNYETHYFDVESWAKTAEYTAKLNKGDLVGVEGRLTQQSWEDKNTGSKRSKVLVTAERVNRLSKPSNSYADDGVAF